MPRGKTTKVKTKKLPKEVKAELDELAQHLPKVEPVSEILETLRKRHPKKYKVDPGLYEKMAQRMHNQQQRILKNSAKLALDKPKSMKELESRLHAEGELWRDTNMKVTENGDVKTPKMPPRTIADIIKKYLVTAVIGDSEKEVDRSLIYFYNIDTGIYSALTRPLEKLCLAVDRRATMKERREAIEYIRLESHRKSLNTESYLIVCNNGIFNKKTGKLEPFNPNYFFTAKIATNYNPNAKEPTYNGWRPSIWFKQIAGKDEAKYKLIWQLIASVCNGNFLQPYAFFLVDDGKGRTGKGTFQEMLMAVVGPGNYASLRLKEFESEFKLASAIGVSLIVGDDNNPNDYHEDNSNFKSMVTGDIVLINPKGLPPYTAKSHALIVQSMNGLPKLKDTTGGNLRRFIIIKFDHQYKDTPEGRKIKDDYIKRKEFREWLLKEAVKVDIEHLAITDESKTAVEKLKTENDPVAFFMQDYFPELKSDRIPTAFLFKFFQATQKYETGQIGKLTQRSFTKKVIELLPAGWFYSKRGLYVGDHWSGEDNQTLKKYDVVISNNYEHAKRDNNAYQGLIYQK